MNFRTVYDHKLRFAICGIWFTSKIALNFAWFYVAWTNFVTANKSRDETWVKNPDAGIFYFDITHCDGRWTVSEFIWPARIDCWVTKRGPNNKLGMILFAHFTQIEMLIIQYWSSGWQSLVHPMYAIFAMIWPPKLFRIVEIHLQALRCQCHCEWKDCCRMTEHLAWPHVRLRIIEKFHSLIGDLLDEQLIRLDALQTVCIVLWGFVRTFWLRIWLCRLHRKQFGTILWYRVFPAAVMTLHFI